MKSIIVGKFLALATLAASFIIMPQYTSAISDKATYYNLNLNSVYEIKQYVKSKKDINIMLYDNSGRIINEFHSDGNEIQYLYDSNGTMIESIDSYNGKQVYERDASKRLTAIKTFNNNHLVEEKKVGVTEFENLMTSTTDSNLIISPMSTTVYEDTIIKGIDMNQLISDSQFTNTSTMTSDSIQTFLESKDSILKDTVLIYYLDTSGKPYFKGDTINAASSIASNAKSNGVNPKVVLATLQKESSLVTAKPGTVAYSSRRFYFAMGYGATDSGDDYTKGGFNLQISGGTATLKKRYDEAPATGYPKVFTNINFGKTVTSNGVTYNNYVWVKNKATYSLYKYTPHTIDTSLLPTVGGGNYLFVSIAKGWWGTNLWD